ncbi:MAG: hypothetical protein ACYSP9_08615 [Planctomycetota bacterium]|jgi:hypothetical protein
MLNFLRGKSGELRVGYQVAARLAEWSARRDGDSFILDAAAVDIDSYWLAKTPIVAHLQVGGHRWVFSAELLSNSGGRVSARLKREK